MTSKLKLFIYLILNLIITQTVYSAAPVFSTSAIPLSTDGFITSETKLEVGQFRQVDKTQLIMTQAGIKLIHDEQVVWFPFDLSAMGSVPNPVNPVFYFRDNGNLCLRESNTAITSLWCTNNFDISTTHVNILPDGSYGRKWGIVSQDINGRMKWGIFGSPISTKGIMPLIPGNFIDRLSSNPIEKQIDDVNQFITNGIGRLQVNAKNGEAFSFNPNYVYEGTAPLDYTIAGTSDVKYRLFFGVDSNLCIEPVNTPQSIWCNGIKHKNQRYVVMPLPSALAPSHSACRYLIVTLDDQKRIVAGQVAFLYNKVEKGTSLTTFPTNGFSNDFFKMTFDKITGLITYTSTLENNQVIKKVQLDTTPGNSYNTGFDAIGRFVFYSDKLFSSTACTFKNSACVSYDYVFERDINTNDGRQDALMGRSAKIFGCSALLPEALLIGDKGFIMAATNNFNSLKY